MSKFNYTFSNISSVDPSENIRSKPQNSPSIKPQDNIVSSPQNTKPQVVDMEEGYLQILTQDDIERRNLIGANVTILTAKEDKVLFQLVTDIYGLTKIVTLPAPARKYSLDIKSIIVPYSVYTARIKYAGYSNIVYKNIQVFASTTTLQICYLTLLPENAAYQKEVVIPPHILVVEKP